MLKRISEALNKEVSYVREVYTRYFYFDDIQYLLKDNDDNQYLLVMSYDDNDRQPGYIWSKKVDRLLWRLYNYPLSTDCHKVKNKIIRCKDVMCEETGNSDYRDEFSLNRFELIYPNNDNYVLRYNNEALMLSIDNDKAIVGTWNNFTRRTVFLAMVRYIFKHFKQIKNIEYNNLIYNTCFDNHYWRHPDYYIPLPKTIDELYSRLSSKSRQKIKRERRRAEEELGKIVFENKPINKIDDNDIDFYYKNKKQGYGESIGSYDLLKRNITNIYFVSVNEKIMAELFALEQGSVSYWETTTYNYDLSKYSFGKMVYVYALEESLKKSKKGVSLASSEYEYKKHFGSICYNSYSGFIDRKRFSSFLCFVLFRYDVCNIIYRGYSHYGIIIRRKH